MQPFELFAIRYARHTGRHRSDNLLHGDPHEAGADLDYYIWVARNSERVFVIDTGFGSEAARERGRELIRAPHEALGLLGLEAESVDHVILTHLHYDHAGNLGSFPKACFHVQDAEISFATGRCMCSPQLRHPYGVNDILSFVRCLYHGSVAYHEGTETLAPGLSLHRIGGHSAGLQVVRVWTNRGYVVIASDASHYYENMQTGTVFPIVYDVDDTVRGFAEIYRLADSIDHVIPGHDPLVMALYPPPSEELAGIVARLDVEPALRGFRHMGSQRRPT